ncbi:MAG TPA: dihydrofolate reductase [Steroidobacteraceae bacterium]|nr:dihydrofolate reductase [Steroidobacteraceae bacterium]
MAPFVSLVVAMAENGVIGRDNAMPWRLPDDLKRFKALTLGKAMLMGRKTFDSIGRPLPGRTSMVLTRDPAWRAEGVLVVHTVDEAFERLRELTEANTAGADQKMDAELCAVGGAELYRLVMPVARRIYLTRIHATIEGDTVFPPIDPAQWRETERTEHPADERHAYAMTFSTLERR